MPNKPIIRLCVIALTHAQYTYIHPDVLELIIDGPIAGYNVVSKGQIYGDSPDEWHPFEVNKTILDYVRDVGFDDASYSTLLASPSNPENLDKLITEVDLYIFDPLFLTLTGDFHELIAQLQAAIRNGKKHFCILVPDRIPKNISQKLDQICELKLPLLKLAYTKEGLGEWKAENSDRLQHFLNRIYRQLKNLPSQETLDQFVRLLISNGFRPVDLNQPPNILGN